MAAPETLPSTMMAWQCKDYTEDTARAAKAISLQQSEPVPEAGPGQVLVRVRFAAVEPADWFLITGALKERFPVKRFPFVPGFDAAGEVAALGPECSKFQVGDKVALCLGMEESLSENSTFGPAGAFAEYCVCPEGQVSKLPGDADLSLFAGLPLAGLSAYQALFTGNGSSCQGEPLGMVEEGSKVLVLGGDRSIGHLAVQMAKAKGATVVATASPSKLAWVECLGASQILNYKESDWVQDLQGEGAEGYFDLILDCVSWGASREEIDQAAQLLGPDGQYIAFASNLEVFQVKEGESAPSPQCTFKVMAAKCNSEDLDQLVSWVASGKLKVAVDRIYAFKEARHALHHSILSQCSGKVLLRYGAASSQEAAAAAGGA